MHSFHPSSRNIILDGFNECSNQCIGASHPDGCGIIIMVEWPDNGVSLYLHLWMAKRDELTVYSINPDGLEGCCVGFVAMEPSKGDNGNRFDSVPFWVTISTVDHEHKTGCQLYHHSYGYLIAKVVKFVQMKCEKIDSHKSSFNHLKYKLKLNANQIRISPISTCLLIHSDPHFWLFAPRSTLLRWHPCHPFLNTTAIAHPLFPCQSHCNLNLMIHIHIYWLTQICAAFCKVLQALECG